MQAVLDERIGGMLIPDDDTELNNVIMHAFSLITLHDQIPVHKDDESLETRDALKAHDKEKFMEAIKKEVDNLTQKTGTLIPVTAADRAAMANGQKFYRISTTLKCKRKKKGNGEPDKHKARGVARGDQLT